MYYLGSPLYLNIGCFFFFIESSKRTVRNCLLYWNIHEQIVNKSKIILYKIGIPLNCSVIEKNNLITNNNMQKN